MQELKQVLMKKQEERLQDLLPQERKYVEILVKTEVAEVGPPPPPPAGTRRTCLLGLTLEGARNGTEASEEEDEVTHEWSCQW